MLRRIAILSFVAAGAIPTMNLEPGETLIGVLITALGPSQLYLNTSTNPVAQVAITGLAEMVDAGSIYVPIALKSSLRQVISFSVTGGDGKAFLYVN